MAFRDGVLATDEEVVLHLRPHWRTAVRPVIVLVVALTAMIVAWVMLPTNSGGRIGVSVVGSVALLLALIKGGWPLLVWRCTHWVLTDERILLQEGVLTRDRRDLPLARVNDHAMSQSLLDRLFGTGTLTIDSLGERDPAVLVAVPRVQTVLTTLYELVENDRERAGHDEEDLESLELPTPRRLGRSRRANTLLRP